MEIYVRNVLLKICCLEHIDLIASAADGILRGEVADNTVCHSYGKHLKLACRALNSHSYLGEELVREACENYIVKADNVLLYLVIFLVLIAVRVGIDHLAERVNKMTLGGGLLYLDEVSALCLRRLF